MTTRLLLEVGQAMEENELKTAYDAIGVRAPDPVAIRVSMALGLLLMVVGAVFFGAMALWSAVVMDTLLWFGLLTLPLAVLAGVYTVLTWRYAGRTMSVSRLLGGTAADIACAKRAQLETEEQACDPRSQVGLLLPLVWLGIGLAFLGVTIGVPSAWLGTVAAVVAVFSGVYIAHGWVVRMPQIRLQVTALEQLEDRLRG